MQTDLARYDNVVHAIYEAALRPDRWPHALARMADFFDAERALLFTWTHSPLQGGFAFNHNMSASTFALWTAKSMHEDPFVLAAVRRGLMVEGVAVNAHDLVPWEILVATDFYREVWAPEGIAHMCCGVLFDGTDSHKLPTAVSFMRELGRPPFQSHHPELLRRLLAHLSRALGVMFHLRDSQLQLASSLAALNRLGSAVVLLGDGGSVLFANTVASALFSRADTVLATTATHPAASAPLRLHGRLARQEREFQRAVQRALQPLAQDADYFSQVVLLPGDNGCSRWVVHLAPLAPSDTFAPTGAAARAIAFIYDIDGAGSVKPGVLQTLFSMTAAEACAALQLTQGGNADDMAARLGVSVNTFKTQLKAAYLKSGTHRQTDLLKLLLSLASR